ncbi:hypothetical protein DVH24_013876 [Malus domestica]|uniref:Uncharacterized protein n=1 Tax=Malus domestica TaxID=3750 RepID=A0A498JCR7_MALDO|nr:hypothetical protein DVH24_013876 [Malus domestica]
MEESCVREEERGKSRALQKGWEEKREERRTGRMSQVRRETARQEGRATGRLEAISAKIDGEGMVVCSLWGWPVRKELLKEVFLIVKCLIFPEVL